MYWNTAKLTEVVRINPRNVDFALDDSDEVSFLPMAGVEAETGRINITEKRTWKTVKKGYTKFQENDVLVAKITPCMENGKACIARHLHGAAGAGSTEFHVFRPNTKIIEPEWLYLFLNQQRIRSAAKRQMGGAVGQQRVPASFYESLMLPLPDIEKQRDLLESLIGQGVRITNIEEELRSVLKKLKQARASILKAAVVGSLITSDADLVRRIQNQVQPTADMTPQNSVSDKTNSYGTLPRVPSRWSVSRISDLTSLVTSGSRGWSKFYSDEGAIFIRSQDINTYKLELTEVARVSLPGSIEGSRTRVSKGDLLLIITGANVTVSARVVSDVGEAYVSQHVALCRPREQISSAYLHLWLMAPGAGKSQLESSAYGAGKPGLNLQNIRSISVLFPPLPEQVRIVDEVDRRFSVLDQVEATVAASLTRCGKLRQAILKRAFEGGLVPAS
jgi:type I restriction enzyme S subunit